MVVLFLSSCNIGEPLAPKSGNLSKPVDVPFSEFDTGPWEPSEENTVNMGGHHSYGTQAAYNALGLWITAYRSGDCFQIYVDDHTGNMNNTWRLTCYGDKEYIVENVVGGNPPQMHRSGVVMEGVFHYTFGGDTMDKITVFKGHCEMVELEGETEAWRNQGAITAFQAERIATQSMLETFFEPPGTEYRVTGRFEMLGQCFFGMSRKMADENSVAVSADGSSVISQSMVDGTWSLVKDADMWQIHPGDTKVDIPHLWEQRRETAPYQEPGLRRYGTMRDLPVVAESQSERWPNEVVGIWHASDVVGADLNALYIFEGNGIFTFSENRMPRAIRLRYSTGTWWVENNILYLSASSVLIHEGGEEIEVPFGSDMRGGQFVRYDLTEDERIVEAYPISFPIDKSFTECMEMDGTMLWSFYGNHTDMFDFRDNVDFWSGWN